MESRNTSFEGKNINWRSGGSGPALVLVHGFGEDSRIWDGLAAHFKESHYCILPDMPGCGGSEPVEDLSVEKMAALVNAVLKSEGIEKAVVIGHSMGGYIALAFAEAWPEKLCGLGLFHSTAFADSEEKISARQKSIGFIETHGPGLFLGQTLPNLFAENFVLEHREIIDAQIQNGRAFSGETLIAFYRAMIARPDRTEVLKNIMVPVLFIIGEKDMAVPAADTLKQSFLPEKAYIYVFESAGHMGMLEEPEKSREALETFFRNTICE